MSAVSVYATYATYATLFMGEGAGDGGRGRVMRMEGFHGSECKGEDVRTGEPVARPLRFFVSGALLCVSKVVTFEGLW